MRPDPFQGKVKTFAINMTKMKCLKNPNKNYCNTDGKINPVLQSTQHQIHQANDNNEKKSICNHKQI